MKRLDNIIKQTIQETLATKCGFLFEYAIKRNEYKKLIISSYPQILENWCLIRYHVENDIQSDLINHWRRELRTQYRNVCNTWIKDDNSDKRKKVIMEVIDLKDLREVEIIRGTIIDKFDEEGIDIHSEEFNNTALECARSVESILLLCAEPYERAREVI